MYFLESPFCIIGIVMITGMMWYHKFKNDSLGMFASGFTLIAYILIIKGVI
jgi:hypothetical protein